MANEYLADGVFDFSGGQNAAFDPSRIPENTYPAGINVTTDKIVIRPRWGWKKLNLDFSQTGSYTRASTVQVSFKSIFHSGRFQALIPYSIGSSFYVIVIVSGFLFLISQDTYQVTVLNPKDPVNILHPRVNWSPAGRYLVIFDFPNYPLIVQGTVVHRADPAKDEVPVSVLGTYNQNRLFIGNAGNEFTAGDASGNKATPDAPITFFEIIQPSSPYINQIFQLPTNYGNSPITAMGFLQAVDTSTGIGPLLVATAQAVYAFHTEVPRAQWEAGQFGSNILFNNGIAGQRAFVNVNSDIIFMSADGQVRTFSMSRDEQRRWSNSPISREVSNWLIFNDVSLIPYSVLSYFKNKIFVTANPYRVPCTDANGNRWFDVAFGGFAVLELDTTATMTTQSLPVWAGLWTGVRPMDMINNNEQGFVISKDSFSNELYLATPEVRVDNIDGVKRLIRSRLYTRELLFKSETVNKMLHHLSGFLQNMEEKVTMDVAYKPSQGGHYEPWNTFKHTAPICQSDFANFDFAGFAPQTIRDLELGGVSSNVCEEATKELYNIFKKVQLRVDIVGPYWELAGMLVNAKVMADSGFDFMCEQLVPTPSKKVCNTDWSNDYGIDNRCS